MIFSGPPRGILLYAAAACLCIAAAAALALFLNMEDPGGLLLSFLSTARRSGPFGPIAFLAVFTVSCLFLLPTFYLTIGAGLIFGLWGGFLVATLSVASGASAAFLFARYRVRAHILNTWGKNSAFLSIDEAVAEEGWKIVFLSRLSPTFPFNILNYAYGMTRIPFWGYFSASWAGSIPWTLMYVYSGSIAADLASLQPDLLPGSNAGWAMSVTGLIATAAATLTIAGIARRALKKRLRLEEERAEAKKEDFSSLR